MRIRPESPRTAPAKARRTPKQATRRALSGNLDDSLGFLIADSSRYVKRSLYARIAPHGIRGGAWFVLRVLWERDDVTQRKLAYRLGLMEPSVQEMLRAMERDGLVTRQRDEQDRRKMRIRLTPRARKLEPTLMRIAADVNALMLTGLDASEEAQLKRLLGKVRSTLAADVEASATVLPDEPVAGARTLRRSTG